LTAVEKPMAVDRSVFREGNREAGEPKLSLK